MSASDELSPVSARSETPPVGFLDVVAINAKLFDHRRSLLAAQEENARHLAEAERGLGIDRLTIIRSPDGLNEYACQLCRFDWCAVDTAPCPRCHPIRLHASTPLNSRSTLPALRLSPEERDWIIDQLPARALLLRDEGWSAAARLPRPVEEVDAIRKDLLDRADQTDALAREVAESRAGSVWLPLPVAGVFSGRPYLLSRLDAENHLVGRVTICRLEPVVGWMEQHLGGEAAEGFVRREDPGFAVFIPSDHP